MNKTTLDSLGLKELNHKEMMNIEGGDGDRPFGRPDYNQPGSYDKKEDNSLETIKLIWVILNGRPWPY